MTPPAFYPCDQETVSTSAAPEGRVFRREKDLWFRLKESGDLLAPGNHARGGYYLQLDGGAATQRVQWFADEAVKTARAHDKRPAFPDLPVCRLQDPGDTVAVVAKVLRTRGESFDEILCQVDRNDPSMDTIQMTHNVPYKRVMKWAPRWDNFVIRQYMLGIPRDLDKAAAIDGCGLFRTYCHVILPNCIPILIVVGIFTFVASWQDVLSPLIYLDDPHLRTVPLGLEYFRSPYVDNRHLLMTGSLLAMLPVGIPFIIFQRYIMAGIATTGVKG